MQKAQDSYFVSHAGQTYGPWTVAEICQRFAKMELIAADYVYVDASSEWIPILECQVIVEALKAQKPAAPPPKAPPPKQAIASESKSTSPEPLSSAKTKEPSRAEPELGDLHDASSDKAEWFVQKDTHRYGPFTQLGLIRGLQEKTIFDYDLIWRKGMESWVRVMDHELFKPEAIRHIRKENPTEAKRFFFERKHPRLDVQCDVLVHNGKSVWVAKAFQLSEGGCGLLIPNALLQPGQVLTLHFPEWNGLKAFHATAEIMSKRFVPNVRDARTKVPYGVKFLKVEKKVQQALHEFVVSRAA